MTHETPATSSTPDSPETKEPDTSGAEPFARRPCLTLAIQDWVETLPLEERAAWRSEQSRSND